MASEENPVVKAALSILPLYGVECWRNQAIRVPGRRFNGKKGLGDVLGLSRIARFVNVELKKPDGKASDEQLEFHELVLSRGGVSIIATSPIEVYQSIEEAVRKGLL